MARCYGCMKEKTQSPLCEHCGYNEYIDNLPHQLPIGTYLQGRYEIGKVLGQGGFGITYIGWDHIRQMAVAIKEYYPNGIVGRESSVTRTLRVTNPSAEQGFFRNRKRFLQEADVLLRLNSIPQIVHVDNLFEENGTAYIVMEMVRGVDLRRYIRMSGGRLSISRTLDILCPIMEALHKVHEAGLVHQDVSPDNIMLLPDGKAKLLDFGAARDVMETDEAHLQSTEAILKPGFAPMEQYQRKGVLGPWTDVYAFGATIYYCLTGKIPEDAPNRIMENADIPWETIPGLTPWQVQLLKQATQLNPKNRLQTVDQLRTGLFAQMGDPGPEPTPVDPQPIPRTDPQPWSPSQIHSPSRSQFTDPRSQVHTGTQDPRSQVRTAPADPISQVRTEPEKKPGWKKFAAIGGAAAALALVCALIFGGGGEEASSSGQSGGGSLKPMKPTVTEGSREALKADYASIFQGSPDDTIEYEDGSEIRIYMDGENEVGRLILDPDGSVVYRYIAAYNENGDRLYENTYDGAGKLLCSKITTYDEDGDRILHETLDENGNVFKTTQYFYNSKKEQDQLQTLNSRGEIISQSKSEFDADGNEVYCRSEDHKGDVWEYSYDQDGNLISYKNTDGSGKVSYWYESEYDSKGNEIKQTIFKQDGSIESITETNWNADGTRATFVRYDDVNTKTSWGEETYYKDRLITYDSYYGADYHSVTQYMNSIGGQTSRTYHYSDSTYGYYFYDAMGNNTEDIAYNNDGSFYSSSVYEYDEDGERLGYVYTYISTYDNSRTETQYDADGQQIISHKYDENDKLLSYDEVEYDENGNQTKRTTHLPDGSISGCYEYEFDAYGETIAIISTTYKEDGGYNVYTYDGDYNTQTTETYDASGKRTDMSSYKYEYNAAGQKTKQLVYDEKGELKYWTEYLYNADGSLKDTEFHFN